MSGQDVRPAESVWEFVLLEGQDRATVFGSGREGGGCCSVSAQLYERRRDESRNFEFHFVKPDYYCSFAPRSYPSGVKGCLCDSECGIRPGNSTKIWDLMKFCFCFVRSANCSANGIVHHLSQSTTFHAFHQP